VSTLCFTVARRQARAGDEAGARVLFDEGRKLAATGEYAAACEKFEASYRLDPGVGTNFNLADCLEHLGRTASAWTRFLDVATATRTAGQLEKERIARGRAAALEPRLSKLVLRVTSPPSGLVVRRDGSEVPAPLWGAAVPLDPGDHLVEASAPARRPWSTKVVVPATPDVISIEVPHLSDAPQNTIPSNADTSLARSAAASDKTTSTRLPHSTIWLGGAGLAAIAVGAVFAVRFELENAEAKSLCQPDNFCNSDKDLTRHQSLVETATRDRTIFFVSVGAGVASVGAATYLWWRSVRRASTGRRSAELAIMPTGLSGAELALHARW
jgi:hypothetical protein